MAHVLSTSYTFYPSPRHCPDHVLHGKRSRLPGYSSKRLVSLAMMLYFVTENRTDLLTYFFHLCKVKSYSI